jgi:small ligand-binding sensory domain FIST
MRFAAAVSEAEEPTVILRELRDGVSGNLDAPAELAVFFFTSPLRDAAVAIAAELRASLQPEVFLGVSCEGIIGGASEIERRPGASLLIGSLPDVTLRPFHIAASEWSSVLGDDERLQQRVGAGPEHRGHLVLGDPFTTPVDVLLSRLDETFHAPTLGGMASGGNAPGSNLLLLNGEAYTDGVIGVGLGGALRLDTVVSQGCRPVGQPMVVTRAEGNLILELGRRPALEAAQEMLNTLPSEDHELLRASGLFVGVVIDEYRESFDRGDFLVRGLMGVDGEQGALAVGDVVRPGQTVQFHVRDAATAHEDLQALLEPQRAGDLPAGGLVFSCNGRGQRMFEQPHHDVRTVLSTLPGVPLAGFFAMGELGPVGGKSFIHGHTASLALFRPPAAA